jgi:hypothetical protein
VKGEIGICHTVEYAFLSVDDMEIEVGDIEDDADYAGVIDQVLAIGMRWA